MNDSVFHAASRILFGCVFIVGLTACLENCSAEEPVNVGSDSNTSDQTEPEAFIPPPPDTTVVYEESPQEPLVEQASYYQPGIESAPIFAPRTIPSSLNRPTQDSSMSIAFGFDFLQPSWSNDSFRQLLPGTTGAFFPGFSLDSTVDHDYGLAPRFEVGWGFADSDYGLQAGAQNINLSGNLDETAGSGATNETISAYSAINILSVNMPEVSRLFSLSGCDEALGVEMLDETIMELRIGTRYSSVNQNFNASLRQGNGAAVTSSSTANFRGAGITAALNLSTPVSERLWLYGNSRGSMLVGRNEKLSNFAVTPAGGAGATSSTLTQRETDIIPVGEFEAGIVWDLVGDAQPGEVPPTTLAWFKLGYVAHLWSDVGLISAGAGQGFRNGNLLLQGFTFQAGVER